MREARDGGAQLGQDNSAAETVASLGLWMAFGAGILLIVTGVAATAMGMGPGVWIIVAGVVLSAGVGAAVRHRRN